MSSYLALLAGELRRMRKYHIFGASILVALLWIGALYFTEIKDVTSIFPLLLFMDTTSMAITLIGVTIFFEKQEGSIKSMLVSPISHSQYILAKTTANISTNLLTLILLYLYARVFKEISVNLIGLVAAVVLVSFFHSMVGFLMSYATRDFTGLLMAMMRYFLLLMLPVVLEMVGLITGEIPRRLLYFLPTKASMTLVMASVGGVSRADLVLSLVYLMALSGLLYAIVLRRFHQFAVRESGV